MVGRRKEAVAIGKVLGQTIGVVQALGESDGRTYLLEGDLYEMTPTEGRHGGIAANVAGPLWAFVLPRRLGRVYVAKTGFILSRDPDTLMAPDVAFVRAERLPPLEDQRGFLELAPDLAVEIVSPSERGARLANKIRVHLAAGTRMVWVVDPDHGTALVYRPEAAPTMLARGDTLDGGDVLPGFRLAMEDLFV